MLVKYKRLFRYFGTLFVKTNNMKKRKKTNWKLIKFNPRCWQIGSLPDGLAEVIESRDPQTKEKVYIIFIYTKLGSVRYTRPTFESAIEFAKIKIENGILETVL